MRKYLLAAVALGAVATPAYARDGSGYVGVEAGLFMPHRSDVDRRGAPITTGEWADWLDVKHSLGYDADLIAGYDFGMFRLEGEIARKHASHKRYNIDENAPGPFPAGVFPGASLNADGRTNVTSFMLNALVDVGDENGLSFYAGGGAGPALVSMKIDQLGDSGYHLRDWDPIAWQLIAGARVPISNNIDAGLKYRYFSAGTLKHNLPGHDFDARSFVHSHSLLASLVYNFGGAEPPPPPLPPPPPPPPPAPATQTCPDGSVILATSTCPAPPPPPPPPPPTERGERG
jgi:OOP family OmpA-OmpF porin